ncbi:MAG: KpsF/GutQ family sugar-phosphate isomerase [Alphaproteobacteria bacterium]|nr:KpsF/GutQ family sugar-phosphate isomerase [Alphaproteobacteria bacterium]
MVTSKDIESARKVLKIEANALNSLANSLGENFSKAIDLLVSVKGRVIVTGMGKSGLIGRKIAATFASTGTPAFYVHPAEASHGDLGIITSEDVVIAISNSGETPELGDILEYSHRFDIPLIAIAGRGNSTMEKRSTVALVLPIEPEACPLGLAPTTSTTMMLALGDCLAVALLERKGFTIDDFRKCHPGGKLGNKLMKVSDLMHSGDKVPLADEASLMSEVIITMTGKSFGCIGITGKDGKLKGIVTDGDLRRNMVSEIMNMTASQVMTASPKTISSDSLVAEALRIMNETKITSLFVAKDDVPVGILHIHDCLRAGVF